MGSLSRLLRIDRGFTDERSLDVALSLPSRYGAAKERRAFFDLAAERLRSLPGVQAAAVASKVPLTGESNAILCESKDRRRSIPPLVSS